MDHKIILKCRICLDEFDEQNMFDLFKDTEQTDLQSGRNSVSTLKLREKVEFCCGVRIRESPEMPSKICTKCFDLTRMWFNFRQMCVNSQVYLESLCKDRLKPDGIDEADESEYLEYLLDDLQTFRTELRQSTPAFASNNVDALYLDESEKEFDIETEEEYLETISLQEAESEAELDDMMNDMKGQRKESEDETTQRQRRRRTPHRNAKSVKKTSKSKVRAPSPESYMCSICGNVYTKKSAFTYHMSLHSNVKPHECELCGKTFRQVCELKNHMRRHTGERPFKCSFCDRHFIDRSEKHRHERVHTNTRPYVCSVCGKSFMYSAILKNHSKLHSGEKEYSCLVCQKAFTLQHQLKAHLQTITHKQREAQFLSAGYEVVYE